MSNVRAMAVFQGGSNLPEDRFVNTFHFLSPQGYENDSGLIADAVEDFYGTRASGDAVGRFLSPYVKRDYEIRTYDMADAQPREPTIYNRTLPAVSTGGPTASVPEEVAVCLSYHGIPPVTARRRGRIYLGPLCAAAIDIGSGSNPTRVPTQLRFALTEAAVVLVDTGLGWCVYSPTADTWTLIAAGYVDNAFDTQRRRGVESTSRTTWTTV